MSTNGTYRIPEVNWPKFEADFGKLVKRANKMGVPAPCFIKVGHEDVPVHDEWGTDTGVRSRAFFVEVTGGAPVFDGWTMVAVVDRDRQQPQGPHVVHAIGDTPVDAAWRTVGDVCEHCHRDNTGRKTLIVVEHENGERLIVGSTCLRDFLGHTSPAAIAEWAQILATLDDRFAEYDEGEFARFGKAEYRVEPDMFLAATVRVITYLGWVSRSAGDINHTPTADNVADWMLNSHKLADDVRIPELADPLTDDEKAEAQAALVWAQIVGGSDYLDNMAAVAVKESWRVKDMGIAASIIPAYRREVGKQAERQAQANTSQHVGTVGEKIQVEGTVTFTMEYPGHYGTKTLVKIVDDNGNLFVWWASATAPEQGVRVTGKATIKGHSDYQGVNQTDITRFKWAAVEAANV